MSLSKYIGGSYSSTDSSRFYSEDHSFFPDNLNNLLLSKFETGADALAFLLVNLSPEFSKVYFPKHYCFETIERVKLKACSYEFCTYTFEDLDTLNDAVIVWNHFNGYQEIPEILIQNKTIKVLEDCVQSIQSIEKIKGFATFTSLRKWSEIDCALVYSPFQNSNDFSNSNYLQLKKKAMDLKTEWQKNGTNELESEFLNLFSEAEKSLKNQAIFTANENHYKRLNWKEICTTREANAQVLISGLKKLNIELLASSELFVMIQIDNRDSIRKYLASNGIFAPIHWLDSQDEPLRKSLLSLPIDQRYREEDMQQILLTLKEAIENNIL